MGTANVGIQTYMTVIKKVIHTHNSHTIHNATMWVTETYSVVAYKSLVLNCILERTIPDYSLFKYLISTPQHIQFTTRYIFETL